MRLLIFEGEGSENFAVLDLRLSLTPMIWYLRRILGFRLKKKKIRKKNEEIGRKIFLFFLYFKELFFSLQKELIQKRAIFSKLTRVSKGKELNL